MTSTDKVFVPAAGDRPSAHRVLSRVPTGPGCLVEPMWERHLPRVTPDNRHFWEGGRDGVLVLLRCPRCGYFVHPPGPRCPRCLSPEVEPSVVSGLARLYTFTINEHQWDSFMPKRYVIGNVELVEQAGLRLTTNVIGCEPEEVSIGMELAVCFEQNGEVFLPLFFPHAHD